MHRRSFLREQCMHRCILSQHFQRPRSWLKRASFGAKVPRPRNRSGDRPRGGPRTSSRGGGPRLSRGGPRKSCRSRSRKPLPRAGRQAQPEPSRPLPLTAIIGRTGHFIDAVIFRRAGGDETYGGEGGCDVKDVMDFQPNEYLTKVTQEWKWRVAPP